MSEKNPVPLADEEVYRRFIIILCGVLVKVFYGA
jgi:hypothetical protein